MPTPTEELTAISHLLHLSFHRNKNQHRLTKWWSSLSQLKRQVQKLNFELSALETAEKFDVTGGKGGKNNSKRSAKGVEGMRNGESKYVKAAREKVELRAEFMERWLFPGCYLAFSNLVADNQYAALGLLLMGTLARVKRVIRPFGPEKTRSGWHSEDQLQDLTSELEKNDDVLLAKADLGEVVNREEVSKMVASGRKVGGSGAEGEDNNGEGEGSSDGVRITKVKKKRKDVIKESTTGREAVESRTMITTTKGSKKKRKKGDAFDDLFSSLT